MATITMQATSGETVEVAVESLPPQAFIAMLEDERDAVRTQKALAYQAWMACERAVEGTGSDPASNDLLNDAAKAARAAYDRLVVQGDNLQAMIERAVARV